MKSDKNIKPNTKAVVRLFWRTSLENKKQMVLSLALPISQVFLSVAVPYFASKTIGSVIMTEKAMGYFWWLFISAAAGLATNWVGIRSNMILQARTMAALQDKAYQNLLQKSIGFFNSNIGGKLVSDAVEMPSSYSVLVNSAFIKALGFFMAIIVGLVVLLLESAIFAGAVFALLLIVTFLTVNDSKRRSYLRRKRIKAYRKLTSHISDTIVNAATVKAFASEQLEINTNYRLNDNLRKIRENDWVRAVSSETYRSSLIIAMQLLVIFFIINMAKNNPSAIAAGIFAFTYSITITNRFFELNTITRQVEESLVKSAPMISIMNEPAEILDSPTAKKLNITNGKIELKNVNFYYKDDPKKEKVLNNFNLTINPGEKIGLVGPSGGGKSTLTKLLLRFADVTSGEIIIDGQDIKSITQQSLRSNISFVPQEPLLFHRTVRENIAYGLKDASDEMIYNAAKKAYAHKFIIKLPNGYDTLVGERGVKLSGGQRQRIAIARAILKNSPIIILDEATSALDSESENLIQAALSEAMDERTSIVIAHRLSTIQSMDRIIVIDDGSIVEDGKHKDLLKSNGTYKKLWNHQSGGFLE